MVQNAIDARLVDALCLSIVPVLLGDGIRLFESLARWSDWDFVGHEDLDGGMIQLTATAR